MTLPHRGKQGHPEGCPDCVLAAAAVIVVVAAVPAPVAAAVAEQQDQNDDPPPVVVQAAADTVVVTHKNTSEAGFFELRRSFHVILHRHFCAEAGKKLCLTKGFGRDIIMGKRGDLLVTGARLSLLRF